MQNSTDDMSPWTDKAAAVSFSSDIPLEQRVCLSSDQIMQSNAATSLHHFSSDQAISPRQFFKAIVRCRFRHLLLLELSRLANVDCVGTLSVR